ncbi:MAG: nucleoside deaminase [Thiohalocapsa sp.]
MTDSDDIGRNSGDGNSPAESPMVRALAEALAAGTAGEVPVGAVLVGADGVVVAAAGNRVECDHDPTAHAEMLVLRAGAARLGAKRLDGCDLYVSLEPCPMCAAAIALAHIRRLYFAAYDPKGGGVEHGPRIFQQPTCHHHPEVYGGIAERAAASLLRRFFRARR